MDANARFPWNFNINVWAPNTFLKSECPVDRMCAERHFKVIFNVFLTSFSSSPFISLLLIHLSSSFISSPFFIYFNFPPLSP